MDYIIYADESDKSGKYYGNFYGAALVRSTDINQINNELNALKKDLNLNGEIKWKKTPSNAAYFDKYVQIMDRFLEFVKQDLIKIRIMFRQNRYTPTRLTSEQRRNEYFMLYYQFMKHAFGLQHCDEVPHGQIINLKFYFDDLPESDINRNEFKRFIYTLGTQEAFGDSFYISHEDIAEIDSKKHVILQCMDVILGAICFKLNDKHKEKPEGQYFYPKVTKAKLEMYKRIYKHISDIHPSFNPGISTGLRGSVSNAWKHSYRHWNFIPKNHEISFKDGITKRKKPHVP